MKRTLITAAGVFAMDGVAKLLAARLLNGGDVALGQWVHLTLTRNTGMALGILRDSRLAGILLPLAVVACGWLLMRRYHTTPFTQTACGLVLGGFLGNFAERLFRGYVLDMIYFPWLPWFVCNAADIAICFGAALLCISLLARPQDWREKKTEETACKSRK